MGRKTHQTLQMLHEHLQANVVREDRLAIASAGRRPVHARRHVCRRGIQLGQQEPSLRAVLVADNVTWDRESVSEQVLQK